MITFSPFFVEINNFINYFDAGTTTALRFTDDFRVVTLFYSEEIDVQHVFRVAPKMKASEMDGVQRRVKEDIYSRNSIN